MGVRMTENCRFAPVSSTEKLVLLVLADCHNDETGRCFPGLAYLGTVTGLTRRGIQKAIQKLEAAGIIRVRRGHGATSSTYELPSQPYPDQRTKRTGARHAPAQENHPGDAPGTPPEVNVMHSGGEPGSPKPECNQNKEPENNQKGSPSPDRSANREVFGDTCSVSDFDFLSLAKEKDGQKNHSLNGSHKPQLKSKPKGKFPADTDPRFHEIVTHWHEAYQSETGEAYIFHGGRDGAALKRFLLAAAGVTPETFMERARAAWARAKADRFATKCAQAATLHGFCTCWNDIGQQLKTSAAAAVTTGTGGARRPNDRDERGQRPGEIPTDVHVDQIRRL